MPASAAMNQKIFAMGLAVETVSAYLLCCALADEGRPLTGAELQTLWVAGPDALATALADLSNHGIIASDDDGTWRLLPAGGWRRP